MILTLRVLHVFSAAFLVGAAMFNYFLMRPALRLIPPVHALALVQKVGAVFIWLGWSALGVLLLSGLLRLHLRDGLGILISPELFAHSHYRSLAFMVIAWFIIMAGFFVMTIVFRVRLVKKLPAGSNQPGGSSEKKPMTRMEASECLNRLQLVTLIVSILALFAGISILEGGFF